MTKPRKDVKFQHRGSGSRTRRPSGSMSDISENEPSSPRNADGNGTIAKGDTLPPPPPQDGQKKPGLPSSFLTRTLWTFVMIGVFFGAIFAGHVYMIIIVTAIQIISFKEVIAIANVPSRARSLRFTKSLNWYFLAITMYFLYGESVIYYFKHIILVDKVLLPFATHHRFISFMLYVTGFVFFVSSLQKNNYKFQFQQFAWTHMALYLIVVQAHFIMNNILEGYIWFCLPVALVITNDIWAYICGITFGRTQLIALSPKKTVEGFVGAWFFTIFFGYLFTNFMIRFKYFICPVNDLGASFLNGLECVPNPVFLPHEFHIPFVPSGWPIPSTVTFEPIQLHAFALTTFASLIAPFGGFFASGLKRTFNIKDFGDSIPGHGGMTDRMDCQFIMGFFTFMYYSSFVAVTTSTVGSVLESAITGLTAEEQMDVVKGLSRHLVNQGVIPAPVLDYLNGKLVRR